MADEAAVEGHTIDGHTVIVRDNIVYIDGVQATLGRTDVNVFDLLARFFDHLLAESVAESPEREDVPEEGDGPPYLPDVPDLPNVEVRSIEGEPSATIIINVGR